jgi:phosphoenolpyruvate carboxykinase (ATP)
VVATREPAFGLSEMGIETGATLHWNFGPAQLVEQAVVRGEGMLAKDGPLVVATGKHTGRSAKDKFIVRDGETEHNIWWDNNASISPEHFAALKADFLACVGEEGDPVRRRPVRRLAARAPGARARDQRTRVAQLFIRTLLVRPEADALAEFEPEFTIIDLPSFRADPARHGCRSETVIAVNLPSG